MYKREFDKLLQSGPLPKSLMLYGDNDYYLDTYGRRFVEAGGSPDGVLKLYYDEYDFQAAKNHLGQSSLFGDAATLVVRTDRKIPKKELQTLVELAHKSDANRFLLLYTGRDFKTLTGAFDPKRSAQHVRFFPPNIREAAAIVEEEARRLGVDIDRYAIEHLLSLLNLNLSLAVNELHKLAVAGTPVDRETIDRLVYSLAPAATEEFLYALFSRGDIREVLQKLHHLGEDEAAILRSTQRFVTHLFLFHLHIKLHGTPDSQAVLGYRLPRQIEERQASLAVRIGFETYEKLFDILAQGEERLKRAGAGAQKETILFSTLIKIKSLLG